jgi:hypothetical protein
MTSPGTAMQVHEQKPAIERVSVPVSIETLTEIGKAAERAGVSRSAFMTRLLQYGLEAERERREQFMRKMRQYRESADPDEANRLSDEIGEMIFGR